MLQAHITLVPNSSATCSPRPHSTCRPLTPAASSLLRVLCTVHRCANGLYRLGDRCQSCQQKYRKEW
jgi:hypothetical protein